MNILILGSAEDAHATHLKHALEERGVEVEYWDTQAFPTQMKLSWQPDTGSGCLCWPEGKTIPLLEIHSIFWRSFTGVWIPLLPDAKQHQVAYNDAMSVVRSLLQYCPAHCVNTWQAYQFHQEKPLQLAKAKELGVLIPATLVSNDPKQVCEFAQTYQPSIFKPVYGGAYTQWVTAHHLQAERLNLALRMAPVTIQEYIPGTNIRVYVVNGYIYAAEIRSSSLDFRVDPSAQLIPLQLPHAIEQQCLTIAQAFFLEWTAIDWRVKPTGEYVFLEANPSPMFLHFEQQTGFPITQKLVELLIQS